NMYPKSSDDYLSNLHIFTRWHYKDENIQNSSIAGVFQDIQENFAALKDFRLSFKVLSGETTNPVKYPNNIKQMDLFYNNNPVVPICHLILNFKIKKGDEIFDRSSVIWSNSNLAELNAAGKNDLLKEY